MSSRTPNHPVTLIGTFEALTLSDTDSTGTSQYGNVITPSYLACVGIRGDKPSDFELTLITNTAISNKLPEASVHSISGKFMALNNGSTPTLTYNQNMISPRIHRQTEGTDGTPKLTVIGLGHVVERSEVASSDDQTGTRLEVILAHNDWDARERVHKRFLIKYIVPGTKNMVKTFSLYQAGRELQITGNLVDFDTEENHAIVLVDSVAVTSGHVIGRMSTNPSSSNSSPTKPGRNIVKFSPKKEVTAVKVPNVSPTKSQFSAPTAGPSDKSVKGKEKAFEEENDRESESEEEPQGSEEVPPEDEQAKSRGRPRKDILKAAAKRMKRS